MIKIVLSAVIGIHALIHLMGFAKEFGLGPNGKLPATTAIQLSASALRCAGILWLLTCILLISTGFLFYLGIEWFWQVGTVSVILSQALIILYWRDAKWGTIGNVILGVLIIFAASRLSFNKMVAAEINSMTTTSHAGKGPITEQDLRHLPPLVQRWLRSVHVIGKPLPSYIKVRQKGIMRAEQSAAWLPFEAEQYFTIKPAAFVWVAAMHTNFLVDINARDKFENGKGNMLIKAASTIPIANSSSEQIDQGTMLRYLAEMIWFPHAAVSEYLAWEQLDDHHARVTMQNGNLKVTGTFTFNTEGLPVAFEALRWGEFDGTYSLEKWSITITRYESFDGILTPAAADVSWKLKQGEFVWLQLQIMDVSYH